jgi:hypothetical protein
LERVRILSNDTGAVAPGEGKGGSQQHTRWATRGRDINWCYPRRLPRVRRMICEKGGDLAYKVSLRNHKGKIQGERKTKAVGRTDGCEYIKKMLGKNHKTPDKVGGGSFAKSFEIYRWIF